MICKGQHVVRAVGRARDVQEEHEVNPHLRDREDNEAERDPGAHSNEVLATQNEVVVRATASTRPIV